MLFFYLLLALPFAFVWMVFTDHISIASFIIGYVLSLVLGLLLVQGRSVNFSPAKLPVQAGVAVLYFIRLLADILLSSIDVALRVFGLRPLKPGIVAVKVESGVDDAVIEEIIAGLSAHSITVTPGQLVVDYSKDHKVMYVHCLDAEQFAPTLVKDQTRRTRWFRRMLGQEEAES